MGEFGFSIYLLNGLIFEISYGEDLIRKSYKYYAGLDHEAYEHQLLVL